MAQIIAIIFLSLALGSTARAESWAELNGRDHKSAFHIVDISKLSEPPLLPKNGVLDGKSVLGILRSLSREGLLPVLTRLFALNIEKPCLRIKALGDAAKGIHTGQLFAVSVNQICLEKHKKDSKPLWRALYILKESQKGRDEIHNLYKVRMSPLGAEYQPTRALIYEPRKPQSMARIAFEDLHLKLKTNNTSRYFSLLQNARGKSLHDHLLAFGQKLKKPKQESKNKMRALIRMRNIFYRIGFAISKLHQKYARNSINSPYLLGKTFIHGDFHAQNIFFDDASDSVTLIDNETFALSLKKPTSGVNDIVDLYLLHTVKTIAHRFSKIIVNHEMGIEDGLWHDLWHELFKGYFEAYNFSDAIDLQTAFWEFRSKFFKGLLNANLFNSINNFKDQRMLKRFGPSIRRFYLRKHYLDQLFLNLEQTLQTANSQNEALGVKLEKRF